MLHPQICCLLHFPKVFKSFVNSGDASFPFGPPATTGALGAARIFASHTDIWGLGGNQSIDAADMDPYVNYQHCNFDAKTATGATFGAGGGLKDFQPVIADGILRF